MSHRNVVCKRTLKTGARQHSMVACTDFEGRRFMACEKCGAMIVSTTEILTIEDISEIRGANIR